MQRACPAMGGGGIADMRASHEQRLREMRNRNGQTSRGVRRPKGNAPRQRPIAAGDVAALQEIVSLRCAARRWCEMNCDYERGGHHLFCVRGLWGEDGQLRPFDGSIDRVNVG